MLERERERARDGAMEGGWVRKNNKKEKRGNSCVSGNGSERRGESCLCGNEKDTKEKIKTKNTAVWSFGIPHARR